MARDAGGAPSPGPGPTQVYLPAWGRVYDRLVKMLREACEQADELSAERERFIMEIQFLRSGRRAREEISQTRIHQISKDSVRLKRVLEAETVVGLGSKEAQIHCYKKLLEMTEADLEDFKSCVFDLAAENTELKEKLKKFENQVEVSKSGKDIREEIRKLKKAYKTLRSEKDKEISALQAEKDFVWNQLKRMEDDYSGTIKSKKIEVMQATEAAEKLLRNVDELQVASQKKDDEILRLQVEVTNAKERMSILEDELQKLRLVKGKDLETDKNEDGQPETSRTSKKGTNKANRKAMSARTNEIISGTSQVTPDRREVKSPRTRASETNQKRKRSSVKSSLSRGNLRCYTVSPMLLPPTFTAPRLKTLNSSLKV